MDEQRQAAATLLPNADIDFHQILQDELNDLSGVESQISIKIFGQDVKSTRAIGERLKTSIEDVPGLVDLILTGAAGAPQTEVVVDPAAARRIGLMPADVTSQVQNALLGGIATQIRQGDHLIDVRVRLNDAIRKNSTNLSNIPILSSAGGLSRTLPLSALGSIRTLQGDSAITRENQQRYISLNGNVEGRDLGSVINAISTRLRA